MSKHQAAKGRSAIVSVGLSAEHSQCELYLAWLMLQVCKKTSKERLPTLGKYSDRSKAPNASHQVLRETEYRLTGGTEEEPVPPEDKVKAYKVCLAGLSSCRTGLVCLVIDEMPILHMPKDQSCF